jgi:hypothetical protein
MDRMQGLSFRELEATSGGSVLADVRRAIVSYLWRNWFTPQA